MQDITQWFIKECDGLLWGELVKPSALTMMDAMKAIQPLKYHGIEEQHSASLFTLILRTYLLLYCKTIDLVYTELSKGNIIEGEDCWLDHYGLPIKVNDDVEAIIEFANETLVWLENVKTKPLDGFGDQMINRLVFRRVSDMIFFEAHKQNYLRYLDCATSVDISLEQTLLVMQMVAQDTCPSAIQPSEITRLGFDPKVPSYLRQSMPLPEFRQPTFKQSWECMMNMIEELLHVERLMATGDWIEWKRLPIHRSLIQSRFTAFCYDSHQGNRNIDRLAREAILYECGDRNEVVTVLGTLDGMADAPNMQQLKTWRALIANDILMDLIVPLHNPPRQRRNLISLSTQLQHRTMTGNRLATQYGFSPIVTSVLEIFRLDCLLEAALSAIGLNLIHFSEEREVWWWISEIATTRASAPVASSSFKAIWAQTWAYIASAMQNRRQLDRKQGSCGLKEVAKLFREARESLDGLLLQQPRNLRAASRIVSLQQALEHNIRLIDKLGTEQNLMWDLKTNDREGRWIMLLLATNTASLNE
ncbi:hypothetical protein I308_103229 [Cryptococcus tetragattii IND107]|uniref:NAA35-like N-terminal domain-containing protein n=1 Tax=Cryptococcus tetragattii IND107 TaxID=1296105 RepID=A0ABR3BTF5_9TREE